MKKFIYAVISICIVLSIFAGCEKLPAKRQLFNVKLSKYVKLGDYEGIPVDTSSDTFKEFYNDVISSDIENNNFYVKKTEGTVAEGDTANINYIGKKDGVAFEGGTADNYDLKIGSNTFIDGFEEGLIGVNIGDTVDLNLTFPESYQSADLAGQAVVFTVTVNYVTTSDGMEPKNYYSQLGYDSLKDYEEEVKEKAIENYIMDAVSANSEIKDYPKDDINTIYTNIKSSYETQVYNNYGIGFDEYLTQINYTEAQFKEEMVTNQVKPFLDSQMLIYAILDKEGMKVTSEDVNDELEEALEEIQKNNPDVTAEQLKEAYGEFTFEYTAVNDKVLDFLADNAKIK
ncbi:MAG: FKBP-type peptidyl-prolyl cis-trans isomerase [Clostridia bacterium]|nr:FKBP-type peptidyl-prolyl cis-trans isomerase [Clostridia bacterium]